MSYCIVAVVGVIRIIVAFSLLQAEVWDGEGADHTATGGDFGHDFLPTFQSSFYYAWLQGALPLNGVSLAARQCLIGGNCESRFKHVVC